MTKPILVTIAVLLTGCAAGPEPVQDQTQGDEAADPDAGASSASTLSDEASHALATCRRDIDQIENQPKDARVAFAVDACRGLWLRQECSSSFEDALGLESYERAGHILRACRDDYCPSFEPDVAESLALCSASLDGPVSLVQPLAGTDGVDPLQAWSEFSDVIFDATYGSTADKQLLSAFPSTLLQLVVVAPPAGPDGKPTKQ